MALGFTDAPIQKSEHGIKANSGIGTNEFIKSQQSKILSCYNTEPQVEEKKEGDE